MESAMNTSGGSDGHGGQVQAARWLEIAERLLGVRDLMGCKRFAERAVDADPLIEGADQLIAVAEVLLASQRCFNNHVDWYAVLQIDPSSPGNRHPSAVLRQYRRLALLLRPLESHLDGAAYASRLVDEAWAVLSDSNKKAIYDAELDIAASSATATVKPPPPPPSPPSPPPPPLGATFWTACTSCFHLHQYYRAYEGKNLRCPNCRRAFLATPLQTPPPIVSGTDMYYCSWGFLPLGFTGTSAPGAEWKPFCPMFPMGNFSQQAVPNATEPLDSASIPIKVTPLSSGRKMAAKKKVQSNLRKRVLVSEAEMRNSQSVNVRLSPY